MRERVSNLPDHCSARTTCHDGVPVVTVTGEVDLCTVPALAAELAVQLERSPAALVVDLSAVTFFDSTGVHALLDVYRRSRDRHVTVHVVVDRPIVVTTLQLTGLHALFTLHPTLPDALAAQDLVR